MNAVAPVKLHSTFPKLQRLLIFIAEQIDRSFYGGYLIWHSSVFKDPAGTISAMATNSIIHRLKRALDRWTPCQLTILISEHICKKSCSSIHPTSKIEPGPV